MKKHILLLFLTIYFFEATSQNVKTRTVNKILYYKTIDDFFNDKKDSIIGENIVYDCGKIKYTDKKTNKKTKFHLRKDSSIFAFKIFTDNNNSFPIYAISKGQKRYGVYLGGNTNFISVFYSHGHIYWANYDSKNYIIGYRGTIDEFGYEVVFTKKDFQSKKNGDIEYFIKDNADLFNKYINERSNATTYYWTKNHIIKQVEYLRAYNN